MNKIKLLYEAPEAETLVVRFEGNIMSPGIQSNGVQGSTAKRGSDCGFSGWDDIEEP